MAATFKKLFFNRRFIVTHAIIMFYYSINFAEGQAALSIGKTFFNQEASKIYNTMSTADKEQLKESPVTTMTETEVSQRVRRISKHLQTLVTTPSCRNPILVYYLQCSTSV